jgi:ribosomal protein S12 methylthiotransferase accessory factor YcaO
MTRAQRLLTLAYKAHQRGEEAISGRIVSFAFADADSAELFEKINDDSSGTSEVDRAEATLRAAEASTKGSIFSSKGSETLLAIAEKAHKDGLPKVAAAIANAAK